MGCTVEGDCLIRKAFARVGTLKPLASNSLVTWKLIPIDEVSTRSAVRAIMLRIIVVLLIWQTGSCDGIKYQGGLDIAGEETGIASVKYSLLLASDHSCNRTWHYA